MQIPLDQGSTYFDIPILPSQNIRCNGMLQQCVQQYYRYLLSCDLCVLSSYLILGLPNFRPPSQRCKADNTQIVLQETALQSIRAHAVSTLPSSHPKNVALCSVFLLNTIIRPRELPRAVAKDNHPTPVLSSHENRHARMPTYLVETPNFFCSARFQLSTLWVPNPIFTY